VDNWVALYYLRSVSREDRLRDAERHWRLSSSNRFDRLSMVLKVLPVSMS
jgi:hypothetical protein